MRDHGLRGEVLLHGEDVSTNACVERFRAAGYAPVIEVVAGMGALR